MRRDDPSSNQRAAATHGGRAASRSPVVAPCGLLGPPDALGTTALMRPVRTASVRVGRRGRRHLTKEVGALLAGLGERPGAVAESLRDAGVRGAPRDRDRLPVAMFLAAVIGADPSVKAVSLDKGAVAVKLSARWRQTVRVALPPPILTFSAAFDEGLYPALVAPGERSCPMPSLRPPDTLPPP